MDMGFPLVVSRVPNKEPMSMYCMGNIDCSSYDIGYSPAGNLHVGGHSKRTRASNQGESWDFMDLGLGV